MFAFTAAYTRPDGSVPLVGDADDGRVQKLGPQPVNDHRYLLSTGAALTASPVLKQAAGRVWEESFWLLGLEGLRQFDAVADGGDVASAAFPEGGFYVLRHRDNHLFVDCGEVGMHGRGGHGHNDMLSFELMLDGVLLVSDSGSFVYTASREMRNRFRATAAHSGVQVDGGEINRFISPNDLWRLQDDARPVDVRWRAATGERRWDYFRGAHTGYDREPYRIRHTREIALDHRRSVAVIRDRLSGSGVHDFTWRFHCAPGVTVALATHGAILRRGSDEFFLTVDPASTEPMTLVEDWVSPSYGVKHASTTLVLARRTEAPVEAWFVFARAWMAGADRDAALGLLDNNA
jgi:uncharacterized heparinase superfamily protein